MGHQTTSFGVNSAILRVLVASHQIGYSFIRVKGLTNILFDGQGMYMDRFVTTSMPGLLILHGYGNVSNAASPPARASWWVAARRFAA